MIFILSIVLSSLLCLISSGVLIPDICQEEDPEGLPVLSLYYLLDPTFPGSLYSLSLFLKWPVLRVFGLLLLVPDQAAPLLLASCVPILEVAGLPLPGQD